MPLPLRQVSQSWHFGIWDQITYCCGVVLCIVGCLAVSLASTTRCQCPFLLPRYDKNVPKCCQMPLGGGGISPDRESLVLVDFLKLHLVPLLPCLGQNLVTEATLSHKEPGNVVSVPGSHVPAEKSGVLLLERR